MTLDEYARQRSQPQPPEKPARSGKTYSERQEDLQRARHLLTMVSEQLEQGAPPEYILYTAIIAAGVLADNDEWLESTLDSFNGIYGDLAQQNFMNDNAAIALQRLEAAQMANKEKLRAQIHRDIAAQQRITASLRAILDELDEPQP